MTASAYFRCSKLIKRLYEGPLGIHIDCFAERLRQEGHCQQSVWRNLRVVSDFSHWLGRKKLSLGEIDEQTVERYQQFRSRYRCPFLSDRPALNRLLTVLRAVDAIPPKPAVALDPHDRTVEDFKRYLLEERGLAYVSIVRVSDRHIGATS